MSHLIILFTVCMGQYTVFTSLEWGPLQESLGIEKLKNETLIT